MRVGECSAYAVLRVGWICEESFKSSQVNQTWPMGPLIYWLWSSSRVKGKEQITINDLKFGLMTESKKFSIHSSLIRFAVELVIINIELIFFLNLKLILKYIIQYLYVIYSFFYIVALIFYRL